MNDLSRDVNRHVNSRVKVLKLNIRLFLRIIFWVNRRKQRTCVRRTFRIPVFAYTRLRYELQNRTGQRYIMRTMGGIKLNRQSGTFDTLISQSFPRCAMEMSVHPSPDVQESSRGVAILVSLDTMGWKITYWASLKVSLPYVRDGRIVILTRKPTLPSPKKTFVTILNEKYIPGLVIKYR